MSVCYVVQQPQTFLYVVQLLLVPSKHKYCLGALMQFVAMEHGDVHFGLVLIAKPRQFGKHAWACRASSLTCIQGAPGHKLLQYMPLLVHSVRSCPLKGYLDIKVMHMGGRTPYSYEGGACIAYCWLSCCFSRLILLYWVQAGWSCPKGG
jgi:hypothetical protein